MCRSSIAYAFRIALLAAAVTSLTGCDEGADRAVDRSPADEAARSVVEAEGVTLTVRAAPKRIQVGDHLILAVEVVAPSDMNVELPQLDESLGDFTVLDARTPPDVPEGDRRCWTHRYMLDTFAAGELTIPAITISYAHGTENDDETDGQDAHELSSEPLTINVASALTGDDQPGEFRDIKGMVDVPRDPRPRWPWIVGAAILVLVGAGLLVMILMRRKRTRLPAAAPPPPPHLWARRELDALASDDLLAGRQFHEFYYRLSGIVREYIERRFHIMAPEQTTEEFLREMRRHEILGEGHKSLLASFLRAADMVKFARHEPSIADGEHAFAAARSFVDDTAPTPAGQGPQSHQGREPVEVAS